jgi:DNA-binding CsgD family transcriptional regulator
MSEAGVCRWRDEYGRTVDEVRRAWLVEAASFRRWCERLWQTQRRCRDPEPATSEWPTVAGLKRRWNEVSAGHLIQAREQLRNAAAGRKLPPCEYEVLDPPRRPPHDDWRQAYRAELSDLDLAADLLEHGVDRVLRRARLTDREADVARLWLAGASPSSIARILGVSGRLAPLLLHNVRVKLHALSEPAPDRVEYRCVS